MQAALTVAVRYTVEQHTAVLYDRVTDHCTIRPVDEAHTAPRRAVVGAPADRDTVDCTVAAAALACLCKSHKHPSPALDD